MAPDRVKFHLVMTGCGLFVIGMLGLLIYVCSRPQTPAVQAAEQHVIAMCRERSTDPVHTEIFRREHAAACREMTKQYVRKFNEQP